MKEANNEMAPTTTQSGRCWAGISQLRRRPLLVSCFHLMIALLFCFFAQPFRCSMADEEINNSTVLVCEGGLASLHCPPQHEIVVHIANFGRFSLKTCNPTMRLDINTQCQNPRTIEVLRASCDHLQRCNVLASVEVFGDSCPGNAKYLEAIWKCLPAKATTTTTTTTLSTSAATTTAALPAAIGGNSLPFDGGGGASSYGDGQQGMPQETGTNSIGCPALLARNLRWPHTDADRTVRMPCGQGSRGMAEWRCSAQGQWTPASGPNLSKCLSDWGRQLRDDLNELGQETSGERRQNWLEVLREGHAQVRKEQLSGGDARLLGQVLAEVVAKLRESGAGNGLDALLMAEEAGQGRRDRQQKMLEFVRLIIDTLGHLLRSNQGAAWSDLSPAERQALALQLVQIMPQTLALLLPLPNWPKAGSESLLAEPTLVAEVAQASIYDYVPFPSMSLYRHNFDTAVLPREALQTYGQNLANVFYTAWDPSLGAHLLREAEDQFAGRKTHKVVSKVVGVSLASLDGKLMQPKQLRPLERPMLLTFQNAEHLMDMTGRRRIEKPRCVLWDPSKLQFVQHLADELQQTTANQEAKVDDCQLQDLNQTHFVCECSRLNTLFAVMADVEVLEGEEAANGGWMANAAGQMARLRSLLLASALLALFCLCLASLLLLLLKPTRAKGDQLKRPPEARSHYCLLLALLEAILVLRVLGPEQLTFCKAMTLGWEFLLLATFCWTFLDALQLSCLSRRFLTAIYETNKSKKCSTLLSSMGAFLFGYGLPLILLALFSQFGNQQPHSCWPPIGASNVLIMFSGPASFLLLGVICLLAGTFWSLRSNLSKCAQKVSGGRRPAGTKFLTSSTPISYQPCSTNSSSSSGGGKEDNDGWQPAAAEEFRLLASLRRRLKWLCARVGLLAAGTSAALCWAQHSHSTALSPLGFMAALLAVAINAALGLLMLAEVASDRKTRFAYCRWRNSAQKGTSSSTPLLLRPLDCLCGFSPASSCNRGVEEKRKRDSAGDFTQIKFAGHSPPNSTVGGGGGHFTPNSSSSTGSSASGGGGHGPGLSACSELSNTGDIQLSASSGTCSAVQQLPPPAPLLQLYQEHKMQQQLQRQGSNGSQSAVSASPLPMASSSGLYAAGGHQLNGGPNEGYEEYATIPYEELLTAYHRRHQWPPGYPPMGQRPMPTPRPSGGMPVHLESVYQQQQPSPRFFHNGSPLPNLYGGYYGPCAGAYPIRLGMVGQQQVAHQPPGHPLSGSRNATALADTEFPPLFAAAHHYGANGEFAPVLEMGLHSAPPNFPPPPPPAPCAADSSLIDLPMHFRRSSSGSLRSGAGTPRMVLRMDLSRQQPLFSERIEDDAEEEEAEEEE